jgi:major membrane immunogen (membrane-anchored lipoprotein)
MKNLIAMALIATLLLTSCTKRYDCACTFVDSTGKTTQEIVGSMNTTKSKAQKDCDNYPNSFKFVYTPTSCHLQ